MPTFRVITLEGEPFVLEGVDRANFVMGVRLLDRATSDMLMGADKSIVIHHLGINVLGRLEKYVLYLTLVDVQTEEERPLFYFDRAGLQIS